MNLKKTIRITSKILLFVVLVLMFVLSIVNAPLFFANKKTTETDYSSWMNDNLILEAKVVDIAMLGAHDAFSHDIGISSTVDIKASDSLMQGTIGKLIKGFSVRQSKTQTVSAKVLLESGVRYFDVRLSFNEIENEYYTVHNYFSTPIEEVLKEINIFLEANPGEFIILDIQHVYGVDYNDETEFIKIREYFENAGILDYAYPDDIKSLGDISYGDITNNQAEAGVLIFSKFQVYDNLFWDYEGHIRSNWANEDEYDKILEFLIEESVFIEENPTYYSRLRIMQAVATMDMSIEGIFRSFETWSLLNRAGKFNNYLVNTEEFESLLAAMPIVMVDYSSQKNFVDQIMPIIISYNNQ